MNETINNEDNGRAWEELCHWAKALEVEGLSADVICCTLIDFLAIAIATSADSEAEALSMLDTLKARQIEVLDGWFQSALTGGITH